MGGRRGEGGLEMRRIRDGETTGVESTQGDLHGSVWLAASGWFLNLSLLFIPGEVGREERRTHPSRGREGKSEAPVINAHTTKPSLRLDLGGAWHAYNDSATVQRQTALPVSRGPPVQGAACPVGATLFP